MDYNLIIPLYLYLIGVIFSVNFFHHLSNFMLLKPFNNLDILRGQMV